MGEPLAASTHHANALRAANRAGDGAAAIALALEGVASGITDEQPEWAAMLLGAAVGCGPIVAASGAIAPTSKRLRITPGERSADARFAAAYELGHDSDTAAAVDLAGTHAADDRGGSIDAVT